jgi:hypothetical protein
MINPYSHIILYAKGWYEKGDVWGDMKIIVGEWGGGHGERDGRIDLADGRVLVIKKHDQQIE